ncbi:MULTISPECIES: DUF3311 domain-containing protein [unclassified Arthrobacter]|jgi:hypothetical protein|uniref:DUF3311 domain-containing protein n=2 Tax=Micrococcales TaxID=85006 RepID=UPI000362A296|nr:MULTISPECIES: DUF3311 domain-containing protein [unclassified Arthrobacter]KRE73415.1 hypothetical protein ASG79_04710 [Arthrobacter sp. Soil761]TWD56572.1 uncharacterized protein DUF3311 [Arthrobacter sp. AG367]BCW54883.1 hypothetical protein StoSoilB19_22570 [Arthrobacter sp. StoSoilB19]BCW75968.1 hypothetical protein NicSoilB11_22930 [Arthrobacter sp. NicSoilB11]
MSHADGSGYNGDAVPEESRLTRDTAIRGPARPAPYIGAGIILAAAILFPLMPQLYSFDAPRLAGLPFFYWYQLLWVPISAILTGTAYWLVTKEDRRRRAEARPGGPPRAGTASADAGLGGDRP